MDYIPQTFAGVKLTVSTRFRAVLPVLCISCSRDLSAMKPYERSSSISGCCLSCAQKSVVIYSHEAAQPVQVKSAAWVQSGDDLDETSGGLFEVEHSDRCIRCSRAFAKMPFAIRQSALRGMCFNCWSSISPKMGAPVEGEAVRAEGAAARPGLVTNTIKGENAPLSAPVWKTSIRVLRRDVEIKRSLQNAASRMLAKVKQVRDVITGLTPNSLRRMVKTARNIEDLPYMITLTYPDDYPTDGKLVKTHLDKFKRWIKYKGIKGFWFLEFQKRGAPHFHLYVDKAVKPGELSKYWYELVASGDIRHLSAGTQIKQMRETHALAAYAQKYAAKADQKEVPEIYQNVGRFWGRFGGVAVQERVVITGDTRGGGGEKVGGELPDLVRAVSKMYIKSRKRLIQSGVKLKNPYFACGTRSFTAWDIADSVECVIGRMGRPGGVALRPLALLACAERDLRGASC